MWINDDLPGKIDCEKVRVKSKNRLEAMILLWPETVLFIFDTV